jgi:hypothetical protein
VKISFLGRDAVHLEGVGQVTLHYISKDIDSPHSQRGRNLKVAFLRVVYFTQIPVTTLSKAWVCSRSLAGIEGSILAGSMDVCLLLMLCVVR